MAENGNGVTFSWVTKLLLWVLGGVFLAMSGFAAWWASSVWSMASTATTAVIEIRGKVQELTEQYSRVDAIGNAEIDDRMKIGALQSDRDNMQRQLNALSGIRDPKGTVPP